MKDMRYLYLWFFACAFFTACDVYQWPVEDEELAPEVLHIELDFYTGMNEKEYIFQTRAGESILDYEMRYVLRAYPIQTEGDGRTVSRTSVWEYIFTRPVSLNDYDTSVEVDMAIPDGEYSLMVWSDFVKKGTSQNYFYAPDDYAEITLFGEHKANTDMRDAFRGSTEFTFHKGISDNGNIVVGLERPLAKFSFRTTDLKEFIDREVSKKRQEASASDGASRGVNLEDYQVTFRYEGFMPCAYNMFTGKPNDSKTGVFFKSDITAISESDALMGFDYVFVNGTESSVSIILSLSDKGGKVLFTSNPIEVPIRRSQHTIMRGEYLTIETSGGVGIVPDFDGEYDYEVKY